MACEYVCDACGKRAPAERGRWGWNPPLGWTEMRSKCGLWDACSEACRDVIEPQLGSGVHHLAWGLQGP